MRKGHEYARKMQAVDKITALYSSVFELMSEMGDGPMRLTQPTSEAFSQGTSETRITPNRFRTIVKEYVDTKGGIPKGLGKKLLNMYQIGKAVKDGTLEFTYDSMQTHEFDHTPERQSYVATQDNLGGIATQVLPTLAGVTTHIASETNRTKEKSAKRNYMTAVESHKRWTQEKGFWKLAKLRSAYATSSHGNGTAECGIVGDSFEDLISELVNEHSKNSDNTTTAPTPENVMTNIYTTIWGADEEIGHDHLPKSYIHPQSQRTLTLDPVDEQITTAIEKALDSHDYSSRKDKGLVRNTVLQLRDSKVRHKDTYETMNVLDAIATAAARDATTLDSYQLKGHNGIPAHIDGWEPKTVPIESLDERMYSVMSDAVQGSTLPHDEKVELAESIKLLQKSGKIDDYDLSRIVGAVREIETAAESAQEQLSSMLNTNGYFTRAQTSNIYIDPQSQEYAQLGEVSAELGHGISEALATSDLSITQRGRGKLALQLWNKTGEITHENLGIISRALRRSTADGAEEVHKELIDTIVANGYSPAMSMNMRPAMTPFAAQPHWFTEGSLQQVNAFTTNPRYFDGTTVPELESMLEAESLADMGIAQYGLIASLKAQKMSETLRPLHQAQTAVEFWEMDNHIVYSELGRSFKVVENEEGTIQSALTPEVSEWLRKSNYTVSRVNSERIRITDNFNEQTFELEFGSKNPLVAHVTYQGFDGETAHVPSLIASPDGKLLFSAQHSTHDTLGRLPGIIKDSIYTKNDPLRMEVESTLAEMVRGTTQARKKRADDRRRKEFGEEPDVPFEVLSRQVEREFRTQQALERRAARLTQVDVEREQRRLARLDRAEERVKSDGSLTPAARESALATIEGERLRNELVDL